MFERYPNISIEASAPIEAEVHGDEKLQLELEFDVAERLGNALFMGTGAYVSGIKLSSLGPTK